MANSMAGKFWLLDTAGIVCDTPVFVQNVAVTFKVASAGILDLASFNREKGLGQTIVYGQTLGAASAANDQLTQVFPVNNWVDGLQLVTITNIAKCIVNVK